MSDRKPGHEKYGIPGATDAEVEQAIAKLKTELESPGFAAVLSDDQALPRENRRRTEFMVDAS